MTGSMISSDPRRNYAGPKKLNSNIEAWLRQQDNTTKEMFRY